MKNKLKRKILLVEDDRDLNSLYLMLLESANYQVTSLFSAHEVEKILVSDKFDLLLLDIVLPDVSGVDLLKRLSENKSLTLPKTYMLTNISQAEVIAKAMKYGAEGFIIKSRHDPQQFIAKINGLF